MFYVENNDIALTKGDSGRLFLKFRNRDGTEYTPKSDDRVIFSVKKKRESFCDVILKKEGCELIFTSEETSVIPTGEYSYDVVIRKYGGEVCTAIEGKFEIRKAAHD